MKKILERPLLIAIALCVAACSVPVSVRVALPIATVPGLKGLPLPDVSGALPILGFDLPVQDGARDLPPGSKKIFLSALRIRSVLPDESDRTADARKDDGLIDRCPDGRARLGFIESVTVKIKHAGEPDSAAVVVASYAKAPGFDGCGLDLQPTGVNIKDYLDGYELLTEGQGRAPADDVEISGYAEMTDEIGI